MERFEAFDENGKKIIFELVETFGMNDSEYAVLKLYMIRMETLIWKVLMMMNFPMR